MSMTFSVELTPEKGGGVIRWLKRLGLAGTILFVFSSGSLKAADLSLLAEEGTTNNIEDALTNPGGPEGRDERILLTEEEKNTIIEGLYILYGYAKGYTEDLNNPNRTAWGDTIRNYVALLNPQLSNNKKIEDLSLLQIGGILENLFGGIKDDVKSGVVKTYYCFFIEDKDGKKIKVTLTLSGLKEGTKEIIEIENNALKKIVSFN